MFIPSGDLWYPWKRCGYTQIKGTGYPEKKIKNLKLGLISNIFEITEYTPRKNYLNSFEVIKYTLLFRPVLLKQSLQEQSKGTVPVSSLASYVE